MGLGRLGAREFDLLSDADVLFVCDDDGNKENMRRVAERLMEGLTAYTRDGTVFPVDARLRPHGREGELIVTLAQLTAYFREEAKPWEALTYLKLRFLAGDCAVADHALRAVQDGISEMANRPEFDGELTEVRERLERSENTQSFKTGPGGIYDLDYLAGSLQARYQLWLAGNLRDRFDAVILPDAGPETLRNGFGPGTIRGEFTGGIGVMGVAALRDFVESGGMLITFNNASRFAIEDLGLPVKNVLEGLKDEQFFCSGSLLRVEIEDMNDAAAWGLPHDPVVMFERGPAFEAKDGFRGRIIAAYPKEQSPLMSGYLLHPERIEGKAAAMEVQYGKGRIYLFGFRPQWRGQSHGTYQFIFNAIYESQGLSKPAPVPAAPAKPAAPTVASQPARPEG